MWSGVNYPQRRWSRIFTLGNFKATIIKNDDHYVQDTNYICCSFHFYKMDKLVLKSPYNLQGECTQRDMWIGCED